MRKKIALLGSTGSIGTNTLIVAKHLQMDVVAMAAKSNIDRLEAQARRFLPKLLAVFEEGPAKILQRRLPHIPVLSGMEGLKRIASFEEADFTMLAMAGSCGIAPAVAAIEAGKQIGLANKEAMVAAGELLAKLSREKKIPILPVDSEHSALFQCLQKEKIDQVRRLILTASGGPFLHKKELSQVTLEEALQHPNFSMGAKGMINSSTLMNKGFEMIEAKWLYGIEPEKIEALIHPQQKIHACVEFVDGSILAQMSEPNMLLPIQYALSFPERAPGLIPPYDFVKGGPLTFFEPDYQRFRCLQLALQALRLGKSYPCFLNAANEVLVDRFLQKEMGWMEIGEKLDKLISSHDPQNLLTLDSILEVDALAREKAGKA